MYIYIYENEKGSLYYVLSDINKNKFTLNGEKLNSYVLLIYKYTKM